MEKKTAYMDKFLELTQSVPRKLFKLKNVIVSLK